MRMYGTKNRRRAAGKLADRGGMSLIELIVGLAISSVVTIMAAQFFSMVVRLHRTSTELSAIQKEAQVIQSMVEHAVMSAEVIYFNDGAKESCLIAGREVADGSSTGFEGQVFYYNKNDRKFYADTDYKEQSDAQTLFNTLRVQSETGQIENAEYLVSNKVDGITLTVSPDVSEMKNLGNYSYTSESRFTVSMELAMKYHESRVYTYRMTAMPRGSHTRLTWNT